VTQGDTLLVDAVWEPQRMQAVVRLAFLALAGSLFMAVCARIQVPMWPVPISMQTFGVLLIGMTFGPRLGAATMVLYLAKGAMGLPVFAGGGGLAYFAGPTAGYLLGFPLAAFAVGWLAQQGWGRQAGRVFLAMLTGTAVVYLTGAGWLALLIGADKALMAGVMPFLIGDAIKAMLAAALLPLAWNLIVAAPKDA
jgi:biotin transport system substrate-specific component